MIGLRIISLQNHLSIKFLKINDLNFVPAPILFLQ